MTDDALRTADPGRAAARPSKGPGDENFPVGSRLIAPALRPHVMAFYAFARAADDVADSADLTPAEKLAGLDAFETGLTGDGPPEARRLAGVLRKTGVTDRHARDLLGAFRQDAVKARYEDWEALAGYCALSAHPVGRFMLDLHGEDREIWPLADPLTAALQVLNHLQDVKKDYQRLDRIYLPRDWMVAEGVEEAELAAHRVEPGLRRVIDRCLDGCDTWLDRSETAPRAIRSRRLAAETRVIQRLARRLARRLRREDPLAGRVRLTKADFAAAAMAGAGRLLR